MLISRQVPFTAFLNSRWVEANPDLIGGVGSVPAAEATNEDAAAGDVTPAEEA